MLYHLITYELLILLFFQTVISYGLIIWGNASKINDVLLIQKKAIRILTDSAYLAHCKPLFIENKILTVVNLYIYLLLNYIKINLKEFEVRHTCYNTRQQNYLDTPFCRLSKTSSSQIVIGLKLF